MLNSKHLLTVPGVNVIDSQSKVPPIKTVPLQTYTLIHKRNILFQNFFIIVELGSGHRQTFVDVVLLSPVRFLSHADPSFLADVPQVLTPTQLDRRQTLL